MDRARRTRLSAPLRAGLLGLALVSVAAAQTGFPGAETFARRVLSGKIDPEHFDFSGYWQLPQEERARWYRAVSDRFRATLPANGFRTCEEPVRASYAGSLWLRTLGSTEERWKETVESMRADLTKIDAYVDASAVRVSSVGLEPRLVELFRRQAREIASERFRREFDVFIPILDSEPPATQLTRLFFLRDWTIECDNARWLARQVEEIGWFDIPRYGAEADAAAWDLLEEIQGDRSLRHAVVEYLEAQSPGTTSGERLARMYDWTALSRGVPFRYGMEGWCGRDGNWEPRDVEDPENLDARRAAKGLMPMAQYAAGMTLKLSCQKRPR